MICYLDRAFCNSPNCRNECKRQLTEEARQGANPERFKIGGQAMTAPTREPLSEDTIKSLQVWIGSLPHSQQIIFTALLAEHAEGRRLLAAVRERLVSCERFEDTPLSRTLQHSHSDLVETRVHLLKHLLTQTGIPAPAEAQEPKP